MSSLQSFILVLFTISTFSDNFDSSCVIDKNKQYNNMKNIYIKSE